MTKRELKHLIKESIKESKILKEEVDVDRFEQIVHEIELLGNEAYNIVRKHPKSILASRAKQYWYGHLLNSVLGGSMGMIKMQEDLEDTGDED